MNVYIDESGDEGTQGKGSRWLVFGCAIVPSSISAQTEKVVYSAIDSCRTSKKYVHFAGLDHASKKGILAILNSCGWLGIVVASDTTKINPGSHLSKPTVQYNYALRYAIERLTKYAAKLGEPIDEIVIEKRRNFRLADFKQYLNKLKSKKDSFIKWDFIDIQNIKVQVKDQEPKLSLADGLAHAVYKALEPDGWWGHYELAYIELLRERLLNLTLMPTSIQRVFIEEYPWLQDIL